MAQANRKIAPAVDWRCANPKCNTELTGVAQQLGERKKDRKVYCLKCAKNYKE